MKLKLKSYNLIKGTDVDFKEITFLYKDYEISFTITIKEDGKTIRVDDGIPVDIVKQAIEIVESGSLKIDL